MKIYQPEKGFRYNSDSLLLYDFAMASRVRGEILDIGCGSGIVGLLLARDRGEKVVGVDLQEEMVSFARKNATHGGIDGEFFHADIAAFSYPKKFHLVVSNPPFYPSGGTQSENRSKNIARYEENLPFEVLLGSVNAHIHNRGSFIFCFDARALQRLMHELSVRKFHIARMRLVYPDRQKAARLVLIEAKKYRQGVMVVEPPLFMDDTAYLDALGKKAKTESVK